MAKAICSYQVSPSICWSSVVTTYILKLLGQRLCVIFKTGFLRQLCREPQHQPEHCRFPAASEIPKDSKAFTQPGKMPDRISSFQPQ